MKINKLCLEESHPKLKNFCDDVGDKNGIDINNDIYKLFL